MSCNTSEVKDSTSTLPTPFRFPEITLPPRNRKITTFAKLTDYFNKGPSELRDAFKTTFEFTENVDIPNSLLEFLDKWGNCKNPLIHYIRKELPEEFLSPILTIVNIHANIMGCALLASLYPCFRRNHLKNFDTEILEKTIAHDFMDVVMRRSRRRRRLVLETCVDRLTQYNNGDWDLIY